MGQIGNHHFQTREPVLARKSFEEALAIRERLAYLNERIGRSWEAAGNGAAALAAYRQSAAIRRSLLAADPSNANHRSMQAWLQAAIGRLSRTPSERCSALRLARDLYVQLLAANALNGVEADAAAALVRTLPACDAH